MDTKLLTVATLAAAVGAGTVYVSTDGETYEKVTLPPAPITDTMLTYADKTCLDAVKAVGDDPQCSMIEAWYPNGGKTRYPAPVYDEDGAEVPPSLDEMRELNFTPRQVWACNGAVMPDAVQDCLDPLPAIYEAAKAAVALEPIAVEK